MAFIIGAIDEFFQLFLPDRVFDVIDILFNGFAAFRAIAVSSVIRWVRKIMISKDGKSNFLDMSQASRRLLN